MISNTFSVDRLSRESDSLDDVLISLSKIYNPSTILNNSLINIQRLNNIIAHIYLCSVWFYYAIQYFPQKMVLNLRYCKFFSVSYIHTSNKTMRFILHLFFQKYWLYHILLVSGFNMQIKKRIFIIYLLIMQEIYIRRKHISLKQYNCCMNKLFLLFF